ncbi:MAG: right-handed parallel beta-helix repeat-containing protein [Methylophaga sp.]|uniref:hypothetical protein n=1 Tax=Methylophaga sp. TaxID=2024840 RepID=UPI000C0D089D|nr:hypothetical protein [Methylophaga sp.]MBL1457690.1 right-handed parallel beta-helix repeat-containing protein [Methylophaga sp.]
MKFYSILLSLLFLGLFSASANAQNYYFCDNGNDNNDGKSQASPKKSVSKMFDTFRGMNGGDSILLCRGGNFEQSSAKKLFNYNCSADKPCTISDYGDENLSAPVIHYTGTHASLWFSDSQTFNADGGYNISNLTLISKQKKGYAIFIADDVDDFHVDNVHVEGFGIGFHSAGSGPGGNGNRMHDRVTLTNSTIINNADQGFLGGCNDCRLENNIFENNGYAREIFNHNIYVANGTPTSRFRNMTIRNNTLYKSTIIDGQCKGVSLVVHGNHDNLIIENNHIKEDKGAVHGHCFGISVDPGYGSKVDESFRNVVIRGNTLVNMGSIGIGCSSCDGALITNNTIIDENGIMGRAIVVPSRTEDSVKSKNVSISNNTIKMVNDEIAAVVIEGENRFKVTGNNIQVALKSDGTAAECFRRREANSDTDVSNNSCGTHNGLVIIEEPEVTEPEPEVTEPEPEVTEPEPEVTEPEPEVTEPEPEVTEPEPEVTEPEPEVTEPEPEVTEPEPEVTEPEPEVTEPETEVVDNNPPSVDTTVTWRDVMQSRRNNWGTSPETSTDLSNCRVIARGVCFMR